MLLLLPVDFIRFWCIQLPLGLIAYFSSLNLSLLRFFSLSLLLRTFFQPLKNEYRQGLVGFSIGMGIAIRSVLLATALSFLLIFITLEIFFTASIVALPFLSLLFLLGKL